MHVFEIEEVLARLENQGSSASDLGRGVTDEPGVIRPEITARRGRNLTLVLAADKAVVGGHANPVATGLEDTSRRSGRDPARHPGVPPEREHLAPCPRSDRHRPGGL